jgi:hypothetical protein
MTAPAFRPGDYDRKVAELRARMVREAAEAGGDAAARETAAEAAIRELFDWCYEVRMLVTWRGCSDSIRGVPGPGTPKPAGAPPPEPRSERSAR